jgi:hypothetical protein
MTLSTAYTPHIPFYIIVLGSTVEKITNLGASAFLQLLSYELLHFYDFRDFLGLDVLNWGDLSVPREIEDLGYFLLGTRVGI